MEFLWPRSGKNQQIARMKMALLLLGTVLTLCFQFPSQAQTDTLSVMFYNLTNYGNVVSGCTNTNNGISIKNPEFKVIMKYAMPDLLGVCEMNTNPSVSGGFLNNVLNTDGTTHYAKSAFVAEPSGTLTSVLYYNTNKLVLKNQSAAQTIYRLTHHFRLYLKTAALSQGDTIWINALVCHLKAGNTSADRTDRANMTATIRNFVNAFPKKENCLIMGDFNVYTSTETGFQNLILPGTNAAYQFLDPVNRIGSWTSNSSFANVHTQCPSLNSNGCFSGGGLDDRFDFILMNRHLLNDSAKLGYISGTYRAIGNDGLHYNQSINSGTNNSAPAAVINSLFKVSDHLPVYARLRVNGTFVSAVPVLQSGLPWKIFSSERMLVLESEEAPELDEITIFSPDGRCKSSIRNLQAEGNRIYLTAPPTGLHILKLAMRNGKVKIMKYRG